MTRRIPQVLRRLTARRLPAAAAICLLLGLILAATSSAPLPDSALPCTPCHHGPGSNPVGEWLDSPYSETEGGRGCVDCHGVLCRGNGETGSAADSRPGSNLQSLREAVRLSVSAICTIDAVSVEVAVSNVGVGHLLPTGPGDRSLRLELAAHDGERTAPLWRAGQRHLRLPPFATAVSRYRFVPVHEGPVHVSARLVLEPGALELAKAASVCSSRGE